MLFIGYGSLAQALVEQVHNEKIHVFSRSKEKVLEKIIDNSNISWIAPENFKYEKEVWLLLPADGVKPFIEKYKTYFSKETVFYLAATKLMASDIRELVLNSQTVVPVKFITQGEQLKKDRQGLAAVPEEYKSYIKNIETLFKGNIEIINANESDVLYMNREATRMAITLAEEFKREMKGKGFNEKMIDQAVRQIVPGVINAYLDGNLGTFGKQIVAERRQN
ncbi:MULTISPECIES: hypothetical protein [Bacillaceae]|uniref:Pyrroline-5-carboxylate reductase catalytic N-terminal domain-containing protein n=1 Tax=Evansella alkalicola TaxID=745819 RepID=A0ABS6JRK9_9BACI|nr:MULTISPECIES: hypothetical protein [Bacillaceae]MBU9721060.1 hypothetical protein [Bacillus alkalicola]